MRPIPTIAATAIRAGAKARSGEACAAGSESIATMNSSGATSRSWNSRTEKIARPVRVLSRRLSASTGTTIAVEDKASAAPVTIAAGWGRPRLRAMRKSATPQTATWSAPRPKTKRRSSMQALQRQLQPDVEHQEHHAESGDGGDILRIGENREPERQQSVEPAQHMGADHHAGDEKAQHRADPQTAEQGHDDARHA